MVDAAVQGSMWHPTHREYRPCHEVVCVALSDLNNICALYEMYFIVSNGLCVVG